MVLSITRKERASIFLGNLKIGGDAPIAVQSMTCTDTRDIRATLAQIRALEIAGCEAVRVAVPDREAAGGLAEIKRKIQIPLIADIHFDHRLALKAIAAGVEGVRINPGNMGKAGIREIVKAAKERDTVIRIGVNAGSLEKDILARQGGLRRLPLWKVLCGTLPSWKTWILPTSSFLLSLLMLPQ